MMMMMMILNLFLTTEADKGHARTACTHCNVNSLIDSLLGASWLNDPEMMEDNPCWSQYGTLSDVEAPKRHDLAASCSTSMASVQAGGLIKL